MVVNPQRKVALPICCVAIRRPQTMPPINQRILVLSQKMVIVLTLYVAIREPGITSLSDQQIKSLTSTFQIIVQCGIKYNLESWMHINTGVECELMHALFVRRLRRLEQKLAMSMPNKLKKKSKNQYVKTNNSRTTKLYTSPFFVNYGAFPENVQSVVKI